MPKSSPGSRLLLSICPASLCPFQPALPAAAHCLSQPCSLPSGSPLLLWLLAQECSSPEGHCRSHSSFPIPVSC